MRGADIEFFGDLTCPWCYITWRRLATAVRSLPTDVSAQVLWRPFALDPETSRHTLQRPSTRAFLTGLGSAEGIEFAFDRTAAAHDTLDAHRLVWLAARDFHRAGMVDDVVERIYRAHLSEGRDIGDRTTLATLAGQSGLDARRIAMQLAGPEGVAEVRALQRRASDLGIETVPFLLINATVGVRGSRTVVDLVAAIQGASWFGVERRPRRAA